MPLTLDVEAPPITSDKYGALRVGDTRLLVDVVLHAFRAGSTPEAIVQQFPGASLAAIYGVVSYYLRHKEDMDQYLVERAEAAKVIRTAIDDRQGDQSQLRERLLSRRHETDTAVSHS